MSTADMCPPTPSSKLIIVFIKQQKLEAQLCNLL